MANKNEESAFPVGLGVPPVPPAHKLDDKIVAKRARLAELRQQIEDQAAEEQARIRDAEKELTLARLEREEQQLLAQIKQEPARIVTELPPAEAPNQVVAVAEAESSKE